MPVIGRLLLLLLMVAGMITTASSCLPGPDSQGTEFIIGLGQNVDDSVKYRGQTNAELFFSTSSNIPATVTVTTPTYDSGFSQTFTISRGSVEKVIIDHGIRGHGIEKSNKSVWIQSTHEISVYALNVEPFSTDAYLALPVDVLGQDYYAMTFTKDPYIMVNGVEDDTTVQITLPAVGTVNVRYDDQVYQNGDTLTVTLNRFDAFHLIKVHASGNFAGAHITSNKPIAVISGNRFSKVALGNSSDHMTEMLPPVSTWGTSFVNVRTAGRTGRDFYRIVASEDNTVATVNTLGTYNLPFAGSFKQFYVDSTPTTLTSDKPVLVALFTRTYNNDGSYGGDPSMTLIIPIPQYSADYTWAAVASPKGNFTNFITVVIEDSDKSGLRLNGASVTWDSTTRVKGTILVQLWVIVSPGTHNVYHINPAVTFMAVASGSRAAESYGYQAGMRMASINGPCTLTFGLPGDILDNDCDGLVDEETSNGIDDDGDGEIDEDLACFPRVDGNWGQWDSWENCSESCGTGRTRTRSRECNDPPPTNNGFDCVGESAEGEPCEDTPCAVDGNWGQWDSWGNCSESCGSGRTRTRSRECNDPPPANNGLDCVGDPAEGEACEDTPCADDGQWGQWGEWGSCSLTCGGTGFRIRDRDCDSPAPGPTGRNCTGESVQTESCTTGDCPMGEWGQWGNWSSCSLTCGGTGIWVRTRGCDSSTGDNCRGESVETGSCTTGPCPVGVWGQWGNWSSCSLTCGGMGIWVRTRDCDSSTGHNCTGESVETGSCTTGPCPVNGKWSTWQTWGSCSVTCGEAGGVRTRTRTCDNPAPAFGGDDCPCNNTDTESCWPGPCPVDGEWGAWCSWGSCFGTCGHCLQRRTRPCNNPTPEYGGDHCEGNCSDITECDAMVCHRHNEIHYVKNKKTCQISGGQVNTFTGVEGSFNFTCLFEAARLYDFEVRKDYHLSLNIYAMAMDQDMDGNTHVSKVTVAVIEKHHATVMRNATFSITDNAIRDVFNDPSTFTAAEDLWMMTDPGSLRDDYMCFGYENGMVTLSVKQRREKAACIEVLTYQPYMDCMDMNPGLVISAESNKLPTPLSGQFPTTLCSTLGDHSAFAGFFHSLATDLQRIMFSLLDQNLAQMNTDCSAAVTAFSACSTDAFKKDAVENCYTEDLADLDTCIGIYC